MMSTLHDITITTNFSQKLLRVTVTSTILDIFDFFLIQVNACEFYDQKVAFDSLNICMQKPRRDNIVQIYQRYRQEFFLLLQLFSWKQFQDCEKLRK